MQPWFGTGKDGTVTLGGQLELQRSYLSDWSPAQGATELRLPGGDMAKFAVDDMVLLLAIVGNHAETGDWTTTTVTGKSGDKLHVGALKKGFNGSGRTVCVIRIPQFDEATITENIDAGGSYNNNSPESCLGVFVLAARRLVIDNGAKINLSERGYQGDNQHQGASWPGKGCKHPHNMAQCHGGTHRGCLSANGGGGGGIFSTPA